MLSSKPMPVGSALKVKKALTAIEKANKDYETARLEALKKFGTKDEEGKLVIKDEKVDLTEENMKLFSEHVSSLLNEEVDLAKISLSDLGPKLEVSAQMLLALDDFLVE